MTDPASAAPRDAAAAAVARLRDLGFETYLAGGCVRDLLLGREPKDFDVATAARPEQVEAAFRQTIAVGKAFGVVRVRCKGHWFEVATFRRDGAYLDGRRPVDVAFSSAAEDASRRDFTINGMFLDPATGEVADFVGGRADLATRTIRAIGDPDARFDEDALRLLRAVRFAAQEGFRLDDATRAAIERRRGDLRGVSPERIREELLKISGGGPAVRTAAARLLGETGLFGSALLGCASYDPERAAVAGRCPTPGLPLYLAALVGAEPRTRGPYRDAVAFVEELAVALRLSHEERGELSPLLVERGRLRGLGKAGPARRRLWATRADYLAHRELALAEGGAEDAVAELDRLRDALGAARPAPLLDGGALLKAGAKPGPAMGRLLRRVRVLQLAGRLADPDAARRFALARLGVATP